MNIVWKRPDNTVAITYMMVEGVDLDAHAEELLKRGDIPTDHIKVAVAASVPPRCEFRNAMVWDGKQIVHDMGRARDIHRERLRQERQPMLDALDREYNKMIGTKNLTAAEAVEVKRQCMRDITKHPAIDAAKTLDDLRAVKVN